MLCRQYLPYCSAFHIHTIQLIRKGLSCSVMLLSALVRSPLKPALPKMESTNTTDKYFSLILSALDCSCWWHVKQHNTAILNKRLGNPHPVFFTRSFYLGGGGIKKFYQQIEQFKPYIFKQIQRNFFLTERSNLFPSVRHPLHPTTRPLKNSFNG
jgi:hypothetical protein